MTPKLNLLLIVSIGVIVTFFLAILLLTILRQGRFFRQRLGLGRKSKPTKYIDAWSKYRLDNDSDNDEPDENSSDQPDKL